MRWFMHIAALIVWPPLLWVTIPLHIIANRADKQRVAHDIELRNRTRAAYMEGYFQGASSKKPATPDTAERLWLDSLSRNHPATTLWEDI